MNNFKTLVLIFVFILGPGPAIRESLNASEKKVAPPKEKKSIAEILWKTIEKEGVEKALKQYWDLKKKHQEDYNFVENELDKLGSQLWVAEKFEAAICILKFNIEIYPRYTKGHNSLGYSYMIRGKFQLAAKHFRKVVELNPRNWKAKRRAFTLENYKKAEYQVPMRDGKKLYTKVYVPRDTSKKYPILFIRDPYCGTPYDNSYSVFISPCEPILEEKYIFVIQDIRGKYMSEGKFVIMRPYIENKKNNLQVDESSDAYDTVEWLLKNIPIHNGRVGLWGMSYPGFLAAMGTIDAHPAVKAVSLQAPMADLFMGDDSHHNGAFYLLHAFNYFSFLGLPRNGITKDIPWQRFFKCPLKDGYKFFLEMGPLANADKKYLKSTIPFWNEMMKHGTYDEFWKLRSTLQHFKNIKPAVLVVGGWFDAENLFGTLATYRSIKKQNPGNRNILVMGPWDHSGWFIKSGEKLGNINFGSKTSDFLHKNVHLPFFNYYLKGKGKDDLPDASAFETGSNCWKTYKQWPPQQFKKQRLYFYKNGMLSFKKPTNENDNTFDEYISDPAKPVPFTSETRNNKGISFMVEDQRFVSARPDVLIYKSDTLDKDITIAGPIEVELFVSTSGTDSDWVVKIIDVFPNNVSDPLLNPGKVPMSGYWMLVRGDVMRGKFRNSFQHPESFVPNKITKVKFTLLDINHCFLKGHKIMVQVQSSWFPLFDKNPQKFVNIYQAKEEDFQKAVQRVFCSKKYPSHLQVRCLVQE